MLELFCLIKYWDAGASNLLNRLAELVHFDEALVTWIFAEHHPASEGYVLSTMAQIKFIILTGLAHIGRLT